MNKLGEMMDYYKLSDDNIVEETPLSSDEKDRIIKATLIQAGLQELEFERTCSSNKKVHGRRFGLMLAACITVFAMGAASFAAVSLNGGFLEFFNPQNQEEAELLNSIGTIIDKQVTAKGLTIDVKEAVGDSNAVYVMFDIIAPEDMVLDKEQYTFVLNHVQIGGAFGQAYGLGYHFQELEDVNNTDNIKPMMLCLSASKNIVGKDMTLTFKDFSSYKTSEEMENISEMTEPGTAGDENDWYNIILKGEWEVTFPLKYTDNSLSWKINEKVMYQDSELKVKKVRISPISINMTLGNLHLQGIDIMQAPWLIHMKNGEVIDLGHGSHGAYSGSLKGTIIDAQFNQILQIEDIESIEFCGTILPIAL
jgi:hypothetical protein